MNEISASQGLVLRKTPYSETSLIFVLLTRDRGLVSLLAKGALRQGKKRFPAVGLFRCLRVQFRAQANRELQTAREVELVADFDRLAKVPNHYRAAVWLSRLVLRNAVAEDPVPQLYEALLCAFRRLAGPRLSTCLPVWLGVVFALLDEQGLLPELTDQPEQEEALSYMLAYATDHELPPPQYSDAVWLALAEWANDYLEKNDLYIPDGLESIE